MSAAARRHRPFGHWSPESGQPWVIAGPCSAESLDQVLETARALKADGRTQLFRAGVWKPRTRPGAFEGAGYNALEWLQIMRAEVGLPFVVEVGNPQHVERALAAGADAVWIGARTTVNPFYVQEIAEALKGSAVPVLVKNPIHADVGLWLGALERLDKMGLSDLAAVHRGFFATHPEPYRNDPRWELSFELRRLAPDLPIFCDPSHIAGQRDLVESVAQIAMDLALDGLMIEI
ncbi:MAG: 3-deoxy-7-phosphoheptulonate synthase, partial [Schleiferiaceae bacterium]